MKEEMASFVLGLSVALSSVSCALPARFSVKGNHYVVYGDLRKPNAEWVWINKKGERHDIIKRSNRDGFSYEIKVYEHGRQTGVYDIDCRKAGRFYSSEWRFSGSNEIKCERTGKGFPKELEGIFPGDNFFGEH